MTASMHVCACLQVVSQSCSLAGCPSVLDFQAVCMATEGCVTGVSAQQQDLRSTALPAQLALWQVSASRFATLLYMMHALSKFEV